MGAWAYSIHSDYEESYTENEQAEFSIASWLNLLNIHPIETQLSHMVDFRVLRMFHPDFHRPWINLHSYSNALGP